MTITEFVKKWEGKDADFDGYFKTQCMDLAQFYNRDVVGSRRLFGNAIDQWSNYPKESYTRIPYKAGAIPKEGDVIIWGSGVGQFGHIAVCLSAESNNFLSFDANWPIGSRCHKQKHTYAGVLGWLRQLNGPTLPPGVTPEEIKDYFRKIWRREPAYGDWRYFDYRLNTAKNIIGEADMLVKMEYWYGRVYDRITGQLNPDGNAIWQKEKAKYPL